MSLDLVLSMAASRSKSERWRKLYRKIHNLFIKDELTHVKDVTLAVKMLDARITQLEANMNQAVVQLNSSMTAMASMLQQHGHPVTTPVGPGAATPMPAPIPQPKPPTPSATTVVQYKTNFMDAEDTKWFMEGPAAAPFMPRSTIEDVKASSTIIGDIGI